MKSLDDLKKMREEALKKVEMRNGDKDFKVIVGMATCGIAAGARPVLNRLVEVSSTKYPNCTITQTGCIGLCAYEPIVEIVDKEGNKTTYAHMTPDKAEKVLASHLEDHKPIEEYTVSYAEAHKG